MSWLTRSSDWVIESWLISILINHLGQFWNHFEIIRKLRPKWNRALQSIARTVARLIVRVISNYKANLNKIGSWWWLYWCGKRVSLSCQTNFKEFRSVLKILKFFEIFKPKFRKKWPKRNWSFPSVSQHPGSNPGRLRDRRVLYLLRYASWAGGLKDRHSEKSTSYFRQSPLSKNERSSVFPCKCFI